MTKFKNRAEKLAFLKGLQTGKRTLEEIVELPDISLSYEDINNEVVIKGPGGKLLTREEARAIRNRTGQNVWIYNPGEPDSLARKAFEEDRCINPKGGRHISFVSCAGCEPLADDEDEY